MDLDRVLNILPKPIPTNFDFAKKGITGLSNLGNTCYLNASIQCLSHTLPLTKYFLKGLYKKYLQHRVDKDNKIPNEAMLLIQYTNLLDSIWDANNPGVIVDNVNTTCYISPKSFTKIFTKFFPEGGIFRQNDSQESIVYLLDTFHELLARNVTYNITGTPKNEFDHMMIKSINDWAKHFKNTHSYILDLFYGQEHLRLQCLNCNTITHNFPPFMYTCLPVKTKDKTKTIYDCFDLHCKVEQLDADNEWECDKCKEKSQAYKKTAYWKLPQILIITFNRFHVKESLGRQFNLKINTRIEYPLINLDLSEYVTNPESPFKYNLYAVCCHTGDTGSGHYYAYCLNTDGFWYEYNDDQISKIETLHEIVTEDAYLLFYQKV